MMWSNVSARLATGAGLMGILSTAMMSVGIAHATDGPDPQPDTDTVLFVGNNWDGTVTVIEGGGDYDPIGRISVIPDEAERLAHIRKHPVRRAYFWGIRRTVGEGNNQYVDDMYSTPDGQALVASRPSFADVASIDLVTGALNWRFEVDGYRADHMAISPDGLEIAISASTGNAVHLLDIRTGSEIATFETGAKPHENHYFGENGRYILNAAIGDVNTPFDAPWLDFTKGDRKLTIYDRVEGRVDRVIDMRDRLDAAGYEHFSDSIRPYALSADEHTLYFQVSFQNAIVDYDMGEDRVRQVIELPIGAAPDDRSAFVNDSRHHGLTLSPDGDHLCVAGTMDEYATIVAIADGAHGPLIPAGKPYWATSSPDGTSCVISESETDVVTIIDYDTGTKVRSVPVGNHPQRVRAGQIPVGWRPPVPLAVVTAVQ